MLLSSFEQIYVDAMIIENLRDIVDLFTSVELKRAIIQWKNVSKKIEEFIPRVAQKDIDQGQYLLQCWKKALEVRDDFRMFSAEISYGLIPALQEALNDLYGPISLEGGKWYFEKTISGFTTVRDNEQEKYLHSPLDPMSEASDLANKIYAPEMDEFHILGCGLGYLPYQIWEKSDRSAHVYIYEDDAAMLEYADQIGVLSWIDSSMLTIVKENNQEQLIKAFYKHINDKNIYISDWKVGYYSGEDGAVIDALDFNLRTLRTNKRLWEINERENLKKNPLPIERFSLDYDFDGKECILVSAGPSLDDRIEFLRENQGERLIIAVNTVLRRLMSEGITPDIATMLSPEMILKEHIDGIETFTENIPLIMPLCGSRSFAASYKGPIYAIDEKALSDETTWDFGGTVTSLALNVAYNLHAPNIYLVGSDLAFSGGRNFSQGVAHGEYEDINNSIWVECSDGGKVQTNNLYNTFRDILEKQISDHPNIKVYNLADHGAKIKGTVMSHL